MAAEPAPEQKKSGLLIGGMARWDGMDLFGPNFTSIAYRRGGKVHVQVEPSRVWKPGNPAVERLSRWPVIRSFFFWGRLLVQLLGSVWTLAFFVGLMAVLFLFVRLMEFGSGAVAGGGVLGGVLGFFAAYPIVPVLALFFLAMRFSPIGRYHGAEHKVVAAYEEYGEVSLENARGSGRIHPRCGTNILIYLALAAALDPLVNWWGYSVLQFILISEAWFVFGQSRPSVAVGNFLQRHLTTTEPSRCELEVAVRSMNRLLDAEEGRAGDAVIQAPA